MISLHKTDISDGFMCFNRLPYRMGNMNKLKSVILDGNPLRSIRRDIIMVGVFEQCFLHVYIG